MALTDGPYQELARQDITCSADLFSVQEDY